MVLAHRRHLPSNIISRTRTIGALPPIGGVIFAQVSSRSLFFGEMRRDKSRGKVTARTVHIEMRCRWEYLIVAVLLLGVLAEMSQAARQAKQAKQARRRSRNANVRRLPANRSQAVAKNTKSRAAVRTGTTVAKKSSPSKASARATPAKVQSKIVGGSTTTISTAPYLVQVRRGTSLCGGSLVSTLWVLCAGHCVKGHSASQFLVRAGTTTLDGSDGVVRSVVFTAVAPRFTSAKMNMDASLLKLNETMTGTNIATISMGSYVPKAGSKVRIAGWGLTSEGGSTSQTLRATQITVVRQRVCSQNYGRLASITKYMFCARGRSKDSCSGDSGGAVTRDSTLLGIVSFGYGCARSGYPGVYTAVARIRPWANRIMSNN
ncbi:trypsin alpha [Drosophila obscura]|uniref:trypsin alpha n=1 Tax=Drosophila obscura TaxID=7282 RepID=UPI001BB19E4F|nr:trypsin alpha [Drosophila obscura]